MKLTPHLHYNFEFVMEKYSLLAVIMTKMDKKLQETYVNLVPDEVSESEFWRNYFYHIELWRKNQGFSHRLGDEIDSSAREAAVQLEISLAQQEIEKLKQMSDQDLGDLTKVNPADTSIASVSTERSPIQSEVEMNQI